VADRRRAASHVDAAVPGALLLSRLGHELRSPLAAVMGLARLMVVKLADGPVDTAQQIRQLELVRTSTAEMLDTVDRVVAIARLDTAPDRPEETFDCREAVTTVMARAEPTAAAHGRRLVLDLPDEPVVVIGQQDGLRQLLTELVDNAIKYTDHAEVRVRCRRPPDQPPTIEVSDDGPGMSIEEQERGWEPFERGAAADRGGPAGSGLGLYFARKLGTHCGARLDVRSTPAAGTTFAVQLTPR
jgi:signal transduction histidine kinase